MLHPHAVYHVRRYNFPHGVGLHGHTFNLEIDYEYDDATLRLDGNLSVPYLNTLSTKTCTSYMMACIIGKDLKI